MFKKSDKALEAEERRRERREARVQRYKDRMAEIDERQAALQRTVPLMYVGGHPEFPTTDVCHVTRSADGGSITLRIGKHIETVDTRHVVRIELAEHTDVTTQHHSGAGGAVVGGLVGGSVGALVGGLATRRTDVKVKHRDRAIWTVVIVGEVVQIVFAGLNNQAPRKWFPQAQSILSPVEI